MTFLALPSESDAFADHSVLCMVSLMLWYPNAP